MSKESALKAILLLGLPGAGKSPFGDFLEKQKIRQKNMHHFDFGRELRRILKNLQILKESPQKNLSTAFLNECRTESSGAGANSTIATIINKATDYFTSLEIERIDHSIKSGELFEEKDKELAQKIFRFYLQTHQVSSGDWLILNGLPRHLGQIDWLSGLAEIKLVLYLVCSEEVARKRLLANINGERTGRSDDRPDLIGYRHRIYRERTEPVLDYYQQAGIPIIELKVNENTRPEDLWNELQAEESFRKEIGL